MKRNTIKTAFSKRGYNSKTATFISFQTAKDGWNYELTGLRSSDGESAAYFLQITLENITQFSSSSLLLILFLNEQPPAELGSYVQLFPFFPSEIKMKICDFLKKNSEHASENATSSAGELYPSNTNLPGVLEFIPHLTVKHWKCESG